MKREIRIVGFDDASFDKFSDKEVLVIGAVFRGGLWLEGVMTDIVAVDGDDATSVLAEMIARSRFKTQLQCIMLDGIAFGGFNVVDTELLHEKTGIPVIAVMRDYPEFEKMHSALKKLGHEEKIVLLEKAGEVHEADEIFFQVKGMPIKKAKELLKMTCTRSKIPEPIRVAHLMGAGIGKGESTGRA